jgi:accessory gene regulator protein AgrB
MKKAIIYTVSGTVGLIILAQSGILDALLAFLLVGAVPGTTYSVPSGFMLLLMATISWLLVLRFAPFESEPVKKTRKHSKSKKQMPKRRYSQI